MAESDTLVNALVGAVVAVVLAFIPFSPALGGAVAGYLQRGDARDGARVGGIAGAIASIPLFLLAALVFVVASFITIAPAGVPRGAFVVALLFVLVLVFVAVYTVGLGALGGVLGVAVADRSEPQPVDAPDTADDRP